MKHDRNVSAIGFRTVRLAAVALLIVAGLTSVVAGVCMAFGVPAALIVGGGFAIAAGLLVDV